MNAREEKIEGPFQNTIDWVFDRSPGFWGLKCSLMDWAERNDKLYWINGVPGSGKSTVRTQRRVCETRSA